MRVLHVASECAPLVKTGGLADVVGALAALPGAAVLLPGWPGVLAALGATAARVSLPGGLSVLHGRAAGLEVFALDAPDWFGGEAPLYQPRPDDALRWAALGRAAALLPGYDVVHAHDWQAGLAPAYLRFAAPSRPSVFTVHNLAFQGQFPLSVFPRLGLPGEALSVSGVEYFGTVGFLKAGLWYADALTTVSPSYAAEIRTPEGGMGLDGLLRDRGGVLHGILNGLDTTAWNPATDRHLAARFDAGDVAPRAVNKAALRKRLGLAPGGLLVGCVGRLTWQKGADLLPAALPALLAAGGQLAVLGSGDPPLEDALRGLAAAHPGQASVFIGFDEGLSRLIYGGADALVMPSRFEPCGLAQLSAMRYGALPLVSYTGGLRDTVIDASEAALAARCATGLHFAPATVPMLEAGFQRLAALWADRAAWAVCQRNAMTGEFGWTRPAARYAALYREVSAAAG